VCEGCHTDGKLLPVVGYVQGHENSEVYGAVILTGKGGRLLLTLRLLMSYIYGAPIRDVSRSHTTTHHSR